MKLEMEQVIKKNRDIELEKDITGVCLQVDNMIVAHISKEGVLKIYLDSLETLGIRTVISAGSEGGTSIMDVRKLLTQQICSTDVFNVI